MAWQSLDRFRDETVPKLNNLRKASEARLRVPPTVWLPAASAVGEPPRELGSGPLIIRSGSPTEDQNTTSNAGQLLSLIVRDRAEFADSLRRVVEALPKDAAGTPHGAVFVQPLVEAEEAGVAFFDGFYYERAVAAGGNQAVTSGQARGDVTRGQLERGEPWSEWLSSVYRVFGRRHKRIDVEFARDERGYVLLQVRPALFPVARNYRLTMANVLETLGDFPSPWTVSTVAEGSFGYSYLATIEPAIPGWDDTLVVEVAGRPWLNISFWYRWCDHIGAPRSLINECLGGATAAPADGGFLPGRLVAALPRLVWGHLLGLARILEAGRLLRRLDRQIEAARGLRELRAAMLVGWQWGGEVAISIAGVRVVAMNLRRLLGLPGPRVITQQMMEDYRRLAELPPQRREAGLDAWLKRYGHRGPLESDVARPRFSELREVLRRDLEASAKPPATPPSAWQRFLGWLAGPLGWPDERREWFRHAWMRRWARLRERLLKEGARLTAAGEIDAAEDVFWLRGDDLGNGRPLREAVAVNKRDAESVRHVSLPHTASLDELRALLAAGTMSPPTEEGGRVFSGIALSPAVVEGTAVKTDDLTALLSEAAARPEVLGGDTILVVPALEPSWAVVFPRVAGVVAEVGGEASHASILLRESRKPAVVNCAGVFRAVRSGNRLRLDGKRGVVEILSHHN